MHAGLYRRSELKFLGIPLTELQAMDNLDGTSYIYSYAYSYIATFTYLTARQRKRKDQSDRNVKLTLS